MYVCMYSPSPHPTPPTPISHSLIHEQSTSMGDQLARSNSQDLFHILGFGSIYRACRSAVSKCYPHKRSSSYSKKKTDNKTKSKPIIHGDYKSHEDRINGATDGHLEEDKIQEMQELKGSFRRRSCDGYIRHSHQWNAPVSLNTSPSPLSRNTSLGRSPLARSTSRLSHAGNVQANRATLLRTMSHKSSPVATPVSLSRSLSRTTSKILYSNSQGIIKPPAMEQQLNCTLEELCFGCIKKVKITRDAIADNGEMVEEDEVLRIKVKPGWTKGTKITFKGKGDEITQGTDPADVVFTIVEKDHPLFTREGDDLELVIELPLVEALTGSTLSIPLLDRQTMSLTVDDIIYPGYKKIIERQGLPRQNELGARANLIVTFLVKFPEEMTEEQRSRVANILEDSC